MWFSNNPLYPFFPLTKFSINFFVDSKSVFILDASFAIDSNSLIFLLNSFNLF